MFFVIVFPFLFWKYSFFNGSGVLDFFKIFPGDWPGYDNFKNTLINYRGNNKVPFPLSLIFPAGLGSVTLILGVGVLYLLSFLKMKKFASSYVVIASLSLLIGYTAFGQHDARFFLEPYFWVLLAYNFRGINLKPTFYLRSKLYRFAISAQALGVFIMIFFGVTHLFPGALSMEWRKSIMMKSAQGYDVMMWANEVLPKDAVVISSHRSTSLSLRKTIPLEWYLYVKDNQDYINTYLSLIASTRPTFFLVRSDKNFEIEKISDLTHKIPCIGEVYAGPIFAKTRTRNPFYIRENRIPLEYKVWIQHFDTDCLKSKKSLVVSDP